MPEISTSARVTLPDNVLTRELDGELVLLDLTTDNYYGLDEIGTRMLQAVLAGDSIGSALAPLLDQYDVESDELEREVLELIRKLAAHGLVEVSAG